MEDDLTRIYNSSECINDKELIGWLFCLKGNKEIEKQHFCVYNNINYIGRSNENTIVIPESSVSKKHAELYFDSKKLIIEDKNSRNGIFINGKKVNKTEILKNDDIIKFGENTFQFIVINKKNDSQKENNNSFKLENLNETQIIPDNINIYTPTKKRPSHNYNKKRILKNLFYIINALTVCIIIYLGFFFYISKNNNMCDEEKSRELFNIAEETYKNKNIHGNLYTAYSYYIKAFDTIKLCEKNSNYHELLNTKIELLNKEIQFEHNKLILAYQSAITTDDYQNALNYINQILVLIPNKQDIRNIDAQKLLKKIKNYISLKETAS
ncbi:MAG: FHA domain-containing protein [Desulfamplus sp.]|nr:FHA domain-containing protein [Desulfamplus sp.]